MVSENLVEIDKYLSAGVHIGTKIKTKSMAPFIYKVNPAGLTIMNVQKIDERIKIAAKFLSKYNPKEILVIGRRENSWKAVKQFSKIIGAKYFTGRYPAGILTNPNLETFTEPKVIVITDPWPDKNAINDAVKIGVPIVALCDSNNTTRAVDIIIPCNNKGAKSLGLVYWILANEYLHNRGDLPKTKDIAIPVEEFVE
ncbi:30S ribosomal protein S2 [Candidatus Woesearchaeota archaeon]|jgi:small subunit ribosomal protein S2|nr:30S ribosomal protein S2 [Candidatus Woesearchaeota archaeon]MBT7062344.1 30S ribosomal protein S2 [Candidatus Woesearchaeota archaeon]MBT7403149.1 30S ribosomal protein S2 [Candidatus Woesearchaeota archaeon]